MDEEMDVKLPLSWHSYTKTHMHTIQCCESDNVTPCHRLSVSQYSAVKVTMSHHVIDCQCWHVGNVSVGLHRRLTYVPYTGTLAATRTLGRDERLWRLHKSRRSVALRRLACRLRIVIFYSELCICLTTVTNTILNLKQTHTHTTRWMVNESWRKATSNVVPLLKTEWSLLLHAMPLLRTEWSPLLCCYWGLNDPFCRRLNDPFNWARKPQKLPLCVEHLERPI